MSSTSSSNPIDTFAKIVHYATVNSSGILNTYQPLTKNGIIEALMFNDCVARIILHTMDERLFKIINDKYNAIIQDSLREMGLPEKVKNFNVFKSARFSFYTEEVFALFNDRKWSPKRIHYVFYENPLAINPIEPLDSVDNASMMKFHNAVLNMVMLMKETIENLKKQ